MADTRRVHLSGWRAAAACAHAMYMSLDFAAFVHKMEAHARRRCYMGIRHFPIDGIIQELSREIYGNPHDGPNFIIAYNALYQMGIYPDVTMLPLAKEYRFGSQEEMLGFFRKRFGARTPEEQKVVDEYVTPMMRTEGNAVVISGNSTFAHVRWRTTKS